MLAQTDTRATTERSECPAMARTAVFLRPAVRIEGRWRVPPARVRLNVHDGKQNVGVRRNAITAYFVVGNAVAVIRPAYGTQAQRFHDDAAAVFKLTHALVAN